MRDETKKWLQADWQHGWHPFTDQSLWENQAGPVIVKGDGVWLEDSEGKRYYDGNSSIWTNLHGHGRPELVDAIKSQAEELCHSSYLGLANARASELAERLCGLFPSGSLERCFFSDNGSTAMEVALRMELQWRQMRGENERRVFITFEGSYHGDTLGAASLGGMGRFFEAIVGLGPSVQVVGGMEDLREVNASQVAAVVIEPGVQGVNEMWPWPKGLLAELSVWCRENGVHLILDEVMTGFGRTGKLFACEWEEVVPDFLCLAKGLTGGTMPLAATLTREEIYEEFKGPGRTFFYGHSYTGNALGCAVALASLDLCTEMEFLGQVESKGFLMAEELTQLAELAVVREVRRMGMISGIALAGDGSGALGKKVSLALKEAGMLTRPILDTLVWMPPLSASEEEIRGMGGILQKELVKAGG